VRCDLGGVDQLSENEKQLVRRIASLSVWCESQEAHMADGQDIDINKFQRTANSLRRLCESVGLGRKPKPVTTVFDIDARLNAEEADDATG
jgi:hypothetical protein